MTKRHILTKAEAADLSENDTLAIAQLERLMNEIIDELILSRSMTSSAIAKKANLSQVTVDRMVNYETKYPRFQTVAKLAQVAGWRVLFSHGRSTARAIKIVKVKRPARRMRVA